MAVSAAPPISPARAALAARGVLLRPATDGDRDLEQAVYIAGRYDEIAVTGWPDAVITAFLADQFHLQCLHYQRHYAEAERWIVEVDGAPAGRLILIAGGGELRIVDIGLLPPQRRRGVGTGLIALACEQAAAQGLARVTLHVEPNNPARRLYRRLGFVDGAAVGAYVAMARPVADHPG